LGAAIDTVLCIHSFSSSARQYRSLAARLASRFNVVAADLYGHGERGPWQGQGRFTISDEASPIEEKISGSSAIHLVAHSYGATVALHIAGRHRSRIRSMAFYEPSIWGTLAALLPGDPATLEIEAVRDDRERDEHQQLDLAEQDEEDQRERRRAESPLDAIGKRDVQDAAH